MQKYLRSIFMLAAIIGCKKDLSPILVHESAKVTLMGILQDNYNFSLFYHAVLRTGADSLLKSDSAHTILLPDNVALASVGITSDSVLDQMSADSLSLWVRYHILPGSKPTVDLPQRIEAGFATLAGMNCFITNYTNSNGNPITRVNGINIVTADLAAANGYIEVLAAPLSLPYPNLKELLLADTNYSLFAIGLARFGLLDQLEGQGPFTILAPTNSSFLGEGITADSINAMDTLHFEKYLYSVSVLEPYLIFNADFQDNNLLPPQVQLFGNISSYAAWLSPYGILYFDGGNFIVIDSLIDNAHFNSQLFINLGPNPQARNGLSQGQVNISDPDHLALNGVLQGLNDILIYPDSVRIHQ